MLDTMKQQGGKWEEENAERAREIGDAVGRAEGGMVI